MQKDNLPKSKTRGLDELEKEVGDISAQIETRLARSNDKVRLLEIGSGYGSVMVDMVAKFGDKVEIHGINMLEEHGNVSTVKAVARAKGISSPLLDEVKFYYFDVCNPWPLPDDHFDIIYSQSVFLHLPDRVLTFHEMNRVLKPDGIARVEACLVRPKLPEQYRRTLVIKDDQRELSFEDYSRAFSNIRFRTSHPPILDRSIKTVKQWLRALRNSKKKRVPRQPYMEMVKGNPFNLGLTLEANESLFDKTQIRKTTYRVNGQAEHPE